MIKLLMMVVIAFGLSNCKTRVNKPAESPSAGGQASDGTAKTNLGFNVPEFLLTKLPTITESSQLKISAIDAPILPVESDSSSPVAYGLQVAVSPELDSPPDYAEIELSIASSNFSQTIKSCSFSALFVLPESESSASTTLKIKSRACVGQDRGGVCGAWKESYFTSTLNKSGRNLDNLKAFATNKQQQLGIVDASLIRDAKNYMAEYEKKSNPSEDEKKLYSVAYNIANTPHVMCSVYTTSLMEEFGAMAESNSGGSNLAEGTGGGVEPAPQMIQDDVDTSSYNNEPQVYGNRNYQRKEKVANITNSLQCVAAGEDYEWVNKERACYRYIRNPSYNKIHKKWSNDKSLAGGFLMFASITAAAIWSYNEAVNSGKEHYRMVSAAADDYGKTINIFADKKQMAGLKAALSKHNLAIPDGNLTRVFQPGADGVLRLRSDFKPATGDLTGFKNTFTDLSTGDIKKINYAGASSVPTPDGNELMRAKKGGLLDTTFIGKHKFASAIGIAAAFVGGMVLFGTGYSQYSDENQYYLAGDSSGGNQFAKSFEQMAQELSELRKQECELTKEMFSACIND